MGLVDGYDTSSDSDLNFDEGKSVHEKKNGNLHEDTSYEPSSNNIHKRKSHFTKSELKEDGKLAKEMGRGAVGQVVTMKLHKPAKLRKKIRISSCTRWLRTT